MMMGEHEEKENIIEDSIPLRKETNNSIPESSHSNSNHNRSNSSNISFSRYADEIFKELKQLKDNKQCFDCGNSPSNWACVKNGIFLCAKCSSVHRLLPYEISDILSIILDEWTDEELNQMKNGGNKRLKDFFEESDISMEDTPVNILFNLSIMNYYRNDLKFENNDSKTKHFLPFPIDYMEMY